MSANSADSVPDTLSSERWVSSRNAYNDFCKNPSTSRLFRVFDGLVGDTATWAPSADTHARSLFVEFDQALLHRDLSQAGLIANDIALQSGEAADIGAVRIVLAARAILTHSAVVLADQILLGAQTTDDTRGARLMTSFLLRVRCRVHDQKNEALVLEVLELKPEGYGVVLSEWLHHLWRYDGPSRTLARDLWQMFTAQPKADAAAQLACAALAARVDDWDLVEDVLASEPKLQKRFTSVLPLARYLMASSRGTEAMQPYIALHDHLDAQTALLAERVAAADVSLAIVGNSPCEIGKHRGAQIDAHDEVVRFNYFELNEQFSGDYGRKFTIHGRGPGDNAGLNARSATARCAVICTYDFVFVPRNWARWVALHQNGVQMAALPSGSHRALQHKLKAEPSLGLAFLSYVKSLRGTLSKDSCFGFSFLDQIDPAAQSARYFGGPPPALTHRWALEADIFHGLTT